MYKLELEDGKYTVLQKNGNIKVLRYGEEWRDETGDKFILSLIQKIEELSDKLQEFKYEE